MTKLSIVIEDEQARELRRIAFDRRIKFQPWVRSAVLALLGSTAYSNAEKPHSDADELLLQSLHEINAAMPTVANRLKQLIVDLAKEMRTKHGSSRPPIAYDADSGDESLTGVAKTLGAIGHTRATKKRA